jgi:uncharacterized protein
VIQRRRRANGLTQRQLAIRAGSTQAAISRLERGELSPTFETFERLLAVMGEEARIQVRRGVGTHDRSRVLAQRARSPEERFALAMSWNKLAGQIGAAGAAARGRSTAAADDDAS